MTMDPSVALRRVAEQVRAQLAVAQSLRDRLLATQVTGTAADGLVTVRVGANGAPVALDLDAKAMRLSADELARSIVAASRDATSNLERRANDILDQFRQIDPQETVRLLRRTFDEPSDPPAEVADAASAADTLKRTIDEEAERARTELADEADGAARQDERPGRGVTIETAPDLGHTDDADDSGWYTDPAQ